MTYIHLLLSPFFEMGQSARILGIIIQDSLDKTYQYGNTYIADILGMILPRIKVLFGFPDMYVEKLDVNRLPQYGELWRWIFGIC